jgi:lipopolysaccharide export system ATP-binding protein
VKIRTEHLKKRYKGRQVVSDVSFEVNSGEIVGLLGPNGAGKTTSFYMTVGLVQPNDGRIFLDETDVTKWPMYKRARAGMGYLPQETSVFRKLSVRDNLLLVLELAGKSREEQEKKVKELAEELSISHILESVAGVLSGGERRRVEIARAMATEPKFILLDEPFAGIDPKTIEEIQSILFQLKSRGIGILITDHNVAATLRITDRNYILVDGAIIAKGTGSEVACDELVKKHYLGSQFGLLGDTIEPGQDAG